MKIFNLLKKSATTSPNENTLNEEINLFEYDIQSEVFYNSESVKALE